MKKLLITSILLLLCAIPFVKADSSYYISVDVANQIVTVYKNGTKQENIVRQMICSSGAKETPTMLGTYTMVKKQDSGERTAWYHIGNGLVKWATRIKWGTMFHSVPYDSKSSGYNSKMAAKMGTPDSSGCIRLWTEDAWWIATHVPAGTKVHIYDDADIDESLHDLLMHVTFSIDDGTYEQFLRGMYTLRLWSWGDRVKQLQSRLNMLGYDCGEPDGDFGRDTEAQVMAFQAQNGFEQDGTVPEEQWIMLFSDRAVPAPIVPDSYGVHIFKLQQALVELGYYEGTPNGTYDAATARAVQRYAAACGCEGDVAPTLALVSEIEIRAGMVSEMDESAPVYAILSSPADLYAEADEDSALVVVLHKGAQVQVLEDGEGFSRVRSGSRVGYVKPDALEMIESVRDKQIVVTSEEAVLYKIDEGNISVETTVREGETFTVVRGTEQFYVIDFGGQEMWISIGDAKMAEEV